MSFLDSAKSIPQVSKASCRMRANSPGVIGRISPGLKPTAGSRITRISSIDSMHVEDQPHPAVSQDRPSGHALDAGETRPERLDHHFLFSDHSIDDQAELTCPA